jgi:hypothetical protein
MNEIVSFYPDHTGGDGLRRPKPRHHGGDIMRMFYKLLIATFAVVVGINLGSGIASANQRFLPSGINSVSASKAKSQVLDYAALNDDYARLLASQTGASEFNRSDYRSRGFSTAKANTLNSSLTGGGDIAKHSGAVGTKTLVLVNIRTGQRIEIMVRCGNPRLKKGGGKCNCKPVSVRKVGRLLVNKTFTKTVTHTCPSGQVVTVTVNGRVKGWVRGTVTGKVIGSAKLYLSQQVQLQVTAQISVRCGEMPPSSVQPGPSASNDCPQGQTRNTQGTCVAVAVACKADEVKDAAGNCVTQTVSVEQACKAKGGTWDTVTQTCTVIVVVGNCSNIVVTNGSGNVVSSSQGGNCNTNTQPPPPPPVDHPPVVNIMGGPAHFYVKGNGMILTESSSPSGSEASIQIISATGGTVAGLVPVNVRWDGTPCPSGKKCFRATAWAGSVPGFFTIKVGVTANGKSDEDSHAFEIKPDDFGDTPAQPATVRV